MEIASGDAWGSSALQLGHCFDCTEAFWVTTYVRPCLGYVSSLLCRGVLILSILTVWHDIRAVQNTPDTYHKSARINRQNHFQYTAFDPLSTHLLGYPGYFNSRPTISCFRTIDFASNKLTWRGANFTISLQVMICSKNFTDNHRVKGVKVLQLRVKLDYFVATLYSIFFICGKIFLVDLNLPLL